MACETPKGLELVLSRLPAAICRCLDLSSLAALRAVASETYRAVSLHLTHEDEEAFTALRMIARVRVGIAVANVSGAARSSAPFVRLLPFGDDSTVALRLDGSLLMWFRGGAASPLPRSNIFLGTPSLHRLVPPSDSSACAGLTAAKLSSEYVGRKRRSPDTVESPSASACLRVAIADAARLFVPCEALHSVLRYDLPGLERLARQQCEEAAIVSSLAASNRAHAGGRTSAAAAEGAPAAVVAPSATFPLPLFARRCTATGSLFSVVCMRLVDPDLLVLLESHGFMRLLVYDAYTAVLRAASDELSLTPLVSEPGCKSADASVAGMVASDDGFAFVASSAGSVWAFDVLGVSGGAGTAVSSSSTALDPPLRAGRFASTDAAVSRIPVCLLSRPSADGLAVDAATRPCWEAQRSAERKGHSSREPGDATSCSWIRCPQIPVARLPPRYAPDGSGSSSAAARTSAGGSAKPDSAVAGQSVMGVAGRAVIALLWEDDIGRVDGQPSRRQRLLSHRPLAASSDTSRVSEGHGHGSLHESASDGCDVDRGIAPDRDTPSRHPIPSAADDVDRSASAVAVGGIDSDEPLSNEPAQNLHKNIVYRHRDIFSAPLLLVTAEAVFEVDICTLQLELAPPTGLASAGRPASSADQRRHDATRTLTGLSSCTYGPGADNSRLKEPTSLEAGTSLTAGVLTSAAATESSRTACGGAGSAPVAVEARVRLPHALPADHHDASGAGASAAGLSSHSAASAPLAASASDVSEHALLTRASAAAPALRATGAQLMGRHMLMLWSPRDVVLYELQRRKVPIPASANTSASAGAKGRAAAESACAAASTSVSAGAVDAKVHRQPSEPQLRRYGEVWSGQRSGAVFAGSLVSTAAAESPMCRHRPNILVALSSGELMRVS